MKNYFEKGVSFRTFILNQSTENRAKFMKYYIPLTINDVYKERLAKQPHRVHILGIVEGTSQSSQRLLAVLEKLISTNTNIELRLVTAADAKEVNQTPTFIFMNEDFTKELCFIEDCNSVGDEELVGELLEIIEKTA